MPEQVSSSAACPRCGYPSMHDPCMRCGYDRRRPQGSAAQDRCLNCDVPIKGSRLFCPRCDRTLGLREREALYPKEKR